MSVLSPNVPSLEALEKLETAADVGQELYDKKMYDILIRRDLYRILEDKWGLAIVRNQPATDDGW